MGPHITCPTYPAQKWLLSGVVWLVKTGQVVQSLSAMASMPTFVIIISLSFTPEVTSRTVCYTVTIKGLRFDRLARKHVLMVWEGLHHPTVTKTWCILPWQALWMRKRWHGKTVCAAWEIFVGLAVQVRPHLRKGVRHYLCAAKTCLLIGCQSQGGCRVTVGPGMQRHVTVALRLAPELQGTDPASVRPKEGLGRWCHLSVWSLVFDRRKKKEWM